MVDLGRISAIRQRIAEIQQQIVEEQDAQLMAQARAAMENLDPTAAILTLRGLSRTEDQIALEAEFTETWKKTLA